MHLCAHHKTFLILVNAGHTVSSDRTIEHHIMVLLIDWNFMKLGWKQDGAQSSTTKDQETTSAADRT